MYNFCVICKKGITIQRFKHSTKTCSPECKKLYLKHYWRNRNRAKTKYKTRLCYSCNKPIPYEKNMNSKLCSKECKKIWKKLTNKKRRKILIKEVFFHYSQNGKISCACCGEDNLEFLTIDHINGNGNIHRKKIKSEKMSNIYVWLKRHKYPEGFQILCMNCNFVKGNNPINFCPVHHPELYQ